MNKQRILWFQDSLKLKTPEHKHGGIDAWSLQLIDTAGNKEFDHVLVDPIENIDHLKTNLDLKEFSVAIDLSGSIGTNLVDAQVPLLTDIHASRMRNVVSERMDGIGNLFSKPIPSMKAQIEHADTSHPLLLDDVCWSGRTFEAVIEKLGLVPELTTVACLVANAGTFGETVRGGKQRLEQNGARVVSALDVHTPFDDGFHLEDFVHNGKVSQGLAFEIMLEIQHRRESPHPNRKEIEDLLRGQRKLLFPNAVDATEINRLRDEQLADFPNGVPNRGFFDHNPPNWLLPSWAKRASWSQLSSNKREIIESLDNLRELPNENKEVCIEIRENQREISFGNKERR